MKVGMEQHHELGLSRAHMSDNLHYLCNVQVLAMIESVAENCKIADVVSSSQVLGEFKMRRESSGDSRSVLNTLSSKRLEGLLLLSTNRTRAFFLVYYLEEFFKVEAMGSACFNPKTIVIEAGLKYQIAHRPSIYVLDTPGVLVPSILDIERGLKLALAGISFTFISIKYSQYIFSIMNTQGSLFHWMHLDNRRMEGLPIESDEKHEYNLKDLLPKRKPLDRSGVRYIENTNVDGKHKIMFLLTLFKGVSCRFTNIVVKKADIDMNKRHITVKNLDSNLGYLEQDLGSEAMFADLGHFSELSIKATYLGVKFIPCAESNSSQGISFPLGGQSRKNLEYLIPEDGVGMVFDHYFVIMLYM
ncbi:hypothetical protein RHGRI_014610 [Rhododendron griersonianum]|uniref:G domain-containing protein n=1 Tax=Rhododendron griersonianum TaxID=479676 RepID=A0AAV6KA06_9ERIC|nr:hypothetical protein RHGRI_014610 [Rhododendron griersonianum]